MARKHRRGAKPGPRKSDKQEAVFFFRASNALNKEVREHCRQKEQAFAVVMRRFVRLGLDAERGEAARV